MTIQRYIHSLVQRVHNHPSNESELRTRLEYARAYRYGADRLKAYRDRAIEREIGKTYTEGAQLAILFNKDIHPDEYEAYQRHRAECKARVDSAIAELESDIVRALEEGEND